jgi:hypothetical protein
MIRIARSIARCFVVGFALIPTLGVTESVRADDPARCVERKIVVTRARPQYMQRSNGTLGTFTPTPYVMIGGNYPTGSVGYSPNEMYGDTALSLYGPLSAFRASTAPVMVYSRGYDGQTRLIEANSFSSPNFPSMSPVVYPTEANYYWGPRAPRTPRWGSNAINWIDQN